MNPILRALTSILRALWRVVRALLLALAALVMFIEEWGWRPLSAFLGRIARWPPLAWIEERIRAAPPRVALVLFLVPAVLLFPLKLAALWLIHERHAMLGLGLIVVAKLAGTALVGRLFVLTEPQLMRYAWFARAMAWWLATKQRVKAALVASAPWRVLRIVARGLRARGRRLRDALRTFGRRLRERLGGDAAD